jgi:molecular chaperone GrpE
MTETPDEPTPGTTNGNASTGGEGEPAETPALGQATPEERIATLEADRADIKDRMLRIAAEFENWKKRARKDQTDGEARVREAILKDMLDVVDNLERATSAYGQGGNGQVDGAAILKGVNLVLRLFQSKLERYGVKPVEALGQPFDPRVHEAISQVPAQGDIQPGAVAAELQKGYRIGDRLLRPAAVAVAVAAAAKGEDGA